MAKNPNNFDYASVGIIGTGNFARALGRCLLVHNYNVVFGSRSPEQRHPKHTDSTFNDVAVEDISECIQHADILFLCIHHEHHHLLKKHKDILQGKVIIDVGNHSNMPHKDAKTSIAEKLANMLPDSYIVKGFNTLSAYAIMDEKAGESKVVYICGDDVSAKERVLQIARTCGFITMDKGFLSSAREVERIPHDLCGNWGFALLITLIVTVCWFFYGILRYYILRNKYTWSRFPMNFLNKIFAEVGLTLLAFCYLPGCFAAIIQIAKGTKYLIFPSWLDKWLKARKYLGLLALLMSCVHAFTSAILMNAQYYHSFYENRYVMAPIVKNESTRVYIDSRMDWRGESSVMCGIIGITLMVIIGITSLPSVGALMNWRQWYFIQSHVGFICLFISTFHVVIKGTAGWIKEEFIDFLFSMSFLGCLIPWFVLLGRIILYMPCVSSYVTKIRKGWERNKKSVVDAESGNNEIAMCSNNITEHSNNVNDGHDNSSFSKTTL